jgi:hypothetical protein
MVAGGKTEGTSQRAPLAFRGHLVLVASAGLTSLYIPAGTAPYIRARESHSCSSSVMATYEQLFNSSVIEVVVPDASIDFPSPGANGDSWYAQLKGDLGERSTAFIGKVPYSFERHTTGLLIRVQTSNLSLRWCYARRAGWT